MKLNNTILAACCVLTLLPCVFSFKLRVLKVQMADEKGAGMDGGVWRVMFLGGGRFSIDICSGSTQSCCTTNHLNTKDDNWQRGEINYFVGSQLGPCADFELDSTGVSLTLRHEGPDGGHVTSMTLSGSYPSKASFTCPIGQKLDDDESFQTTCVETIQDLPDDHCNGHPGFCDLTYDQFTFPGAHNAGTGQHSSITNCALRNHDLNIQEQLDFGLRFFDFDVIYSHTLANCNGLESGHGKLPDLGLYVCFGSVREIFRQVTEWMVEHPREIVTLYFGELQYETDTYPVLQNEILNNFGMDDSVVKLNIHHKNNGGWPTLGEAIETNQRIFVFIRSELVPSTEKGILQEVQISIEKPTIEGPPGSVKILSTFNSRSVDENCHTVIENNREACSAESELTKVAVFGTFLSSGLDCIWEIARKCNPRTMEAIQACLEFKTNVNFVQLDFPNYPAHSSVQVIDYINGLNLAKLA